MGLLDGMTAGPEKADTPAGETAGRRDELPLEHPTAPTPEDAPSASTVSDADEDMAGQTDEAPASPATGLIPLIVASVRQHRHVVLATIFLILAGAVALYRMIPRTFTAQADVWLDHGLDRPGTTAQPGGGDLVARNTEIRVLTSSDLAAEVVDRMGLERVPGIGQPKSGPPIAVDAARSAAIQAVRDGVKIGATGTSYAVSVSFAAADPVLATGVLNQLVDGYVEDRRIGGARGRERLQMQAQAASARDAMIRSEAAVNGYRDASGLIPKPGDAVLIRTELAALDRELDVARVAERIARARWQAASGGSGLALTSPQLRDLLSQRATLLMAPGAAADPATAVRIAEIDRASAVETQRLRRVAIALRTARARTALVTAARGRVMGELSTGEQARVRLAKLNEDAAQARRRYASLTDRFRDRFVGQRPDRRGAYVVAHARPATATAFPDPWLFALGGLAAALLAAGIVVALLETLQKGFRTRQALERKLGLPVIGMVPDLNRVAGVQIPPDDRMAAPDYLYNNRRSTFSAAFRAIHTGLRLGRSAHSPRVLAVCSALPEEGKTTVAICLARSAALAGLRVVLVDCDGRRPAASRALTPYAKVGLADVLEDGLAFRDAIQCDTPSGAWFLPHATGRTLPTGLIASPKMQALITSLKREFDLVILDTPPALALVEAREVAALADAALLVARYRKTPSDAAAIALDMLDKAGAKVSATALTMVVA